MTRPGRTTLASPPLSENNFALYFRCGTLGAADLDRRVVEAGAFGEIGLEIGGDKRRDRLPGRARREPRTLLTGDDPGPHGIGHCEPQNYLAAVVPDPNVAAVPEAALRGVLGIH